MAEQSRGLRFLNAYNLLDHSLRVQYNFKTNISFSDLIRRCASLNQVIRSYEDSLIELARLRNAIVHSRGDRLIAEPHEEVVAEIEKIARIISTPPLVVDVIKSTKVDTIQHTATVKDFLIRANDVGHSNIPAYKDQKLIGVMSRFVLTEHMGKVLKDGRNIEKFLSETTIENYLREFPNNNHFVIASAKVTIEDTLAFFTNKKLISVIITSDGTADGKLMGIVVSADIMDLMKVLEGF